MPRVRQNTLLRYRKNAGETRAIPNSSPGDHCRRPSTRERISGSGSCRLPDCRKGVRQWNRSRTLRLTMYLRWSRRSCMHRRLKRREQMRPRRGTGRNRAGHNLRCCGWRNGLVAVNPLGNADPVVAALALTAGTQPGCLEPRCQCQRNSGIALGTERVEVFSKSHGQLLKLNSARPTPCTCGHNPRQQFALSWPKQDLPGSRTGRGRRGRESRATA